MTLYCTVDEGKKFAGTISYKDVGFETEDEFTEYADLIIEGASRHLDKYCHKPVNFFQNLGVEITEYFNGIGSNPPSQRIQTSQRIQAWQKKARKFSLTWRPILSITTFKELISGTWTTRTEGDSTTDDFRLIKGVIRMTKNIPREGWENVQVVYQAGFTTTPVDIKLATAMLVGNYIQLKTRDRSVSIVRFRRPESLEFEDPQVMTPEVKGILNSYKTMFLGRY